MTLQGYEERIKTATIEADRFIDAAKKALAAGDDWSQKPAVKRAAMKRASMDLTRALANLRNPQYK